MYDVVVIGQGLSGLLSAIWAREEGRRTALVAAGAGKIMQSTGVIDLIPGSDGKLKEWTEHYHVGPRQQLQLAEAVGKFQKLMNRLGYPYTGDIEDPAPIVTGSGRVKRTALYPQTVVPVPDRGSAIVVGFDELADFQPFFVRENLRRERPQLSVESIRIHLGMHSQRLMTQLDAARLLDRKDIREDCIRQIKRQMAQKHIGRPDLFIFPASLGENRWEETIGQFHIELGARVTEAPGLPPNATAVRLYERLKRAAVRSGVRFYSDTTVVGASIDGEAIKSVKIKTPGRVSELSGEYFILATGGILGGGLEVTSQGIKECALHLETDASGKAVRPPINLHPAGASRGERTAGPGIVGGAYTLLSSYEAVSGLRRSVAGGVENV
ncbi:FAD-binding protein [Sporolactobacillus sp. KGMB 08714]|uniref:FAD-binding protein n=1 Tax=Sporolactobacillus sp. KGMB 08714 TaxID=3064704 RepID=UPI002FBE65B0